MASRSDAVAIGGNKPPTPEFLANLNRQASGLPPVGATDVRTRVNGEDVTVPVLLVARTALNKHMDFLKGKIGTEVSDPYRFMGNGPYLDEIRAQWRVMADSAMRERENASAELERLGKLSDAEVVDWAVKHARIGRHVNGGWVVT